MKELKSFTHVLACDVDEKPDIEFTRCDFCGRILCRKGFYNGDSIWWHSFELCGCEGYTTFQEQKQKQKAADKAEKQAKYFEDMKKARIENLLKVSGMPKRQLNNSFDKADMRTDMQKKVAATCERYAESIETLIPTKYEILDKNNCLFITGQVGIGKTYLASCIANYVIKEKSKSVICMTDKQIMEYISSTFDSDVIRTFKTTSLLIIDDLGKANVSKFSLANLYSIIDGRYSNGMPTVITSNYSLEDLLTRLYVSGDKITAESMVDRLKEMCVVLPMDGESRR
jgi:DNA replication protein DnaC